MEDYKSNAAVFKAFDDEKRLQILKMLHCCERCACEILENMQISQSTLSHHMKILCDSGIVNARKDGKWTYYSISEQGVEAAVQLMRTLALGEK